MVDKPVDKGRLQGTGDDDCLTGLAQAPFEKADGTVHQSQIHVYAIAGSDTINLGFGDIVDFAHGHHARGDNDADPLTGAANRGADTFNFQDLDKVDNIVVGRLEDFAPGDGDTLTITGDDGTVEEITLAMLETGQGTTAEYDWRVAAYDVDDTDSAVGTQQWLLIDTDGGYVFYALEGARVTDGDGAANEGNLEAHFAGANGTPIPTVAVLLGLETVGYVDLQNHIPTDLSHQGNGIAFTDNDDEWDHFLNVIHGTSGGDLIAAGLNDDNVKAKDGNDKVWGGSGNDTVNGDAGNDTIFGGTGDDVLIGGGGDDEVGGGTGNDVLHGWGGADLLLGDDGDDRLYGNLGDDTLNGGNGDDKLYGGNGDDRLNGYTGDDAQYGEAGNDRVNGQGGNDTLDGGIGNDSLNGASGDDSLLGGDGDDNLSGGTGADVLLGDAGADSLKAGEGNDTLSGGDGADEIDAGTGLDLMTGGSGSDSFVFKDGYLTDWDTVTGTWGEKLAQLDKITDFENGDDLFVFDGYAGVTDMDDVNGWTTNFSGNKLLILQVTATKERILVDIDDALSRNDLMQADNFLFL